MVTLPVQQLAQLKVESESALQADQSAGTWATLRWTPLR